MRTVGGIVLLIAAMLLGVAALFLAIERWIGNDDSPEECNPIVSVEDTC